MGFKRSWVRIPPARFLDIPKRLFPLKKFQRDGGVAGFPKERWNRYRATLRFGGIVTKILRSSSFFFLANLGGGETQRGFDKKVQKPKPTIPSQLIPMKKTILALALVAGLTSFAGSAKATPPLGGYQFTFSFTGTENPNSNFKLDTIKGILTLNDANTSAISLYITDDIGGNMSFNSNFNWAAATPSLNSFTVSNVDGTPTITDSTFTDSTYSLNLSTDFMGSIRTSYYDGSYYVTTLNPTAPSYTAVTAVPEPSTYALFGLGALALVVAYRRKVA